MRLKSLTLSGFKSFPDRTRLDFGEGVSVVVGPNGSGKSNVTDAVLWAMGEQSPLAIRGQSMQDVIFGGGRGVQPRSAAEVEIVLDNSDGTVGLPLSEISIVRRLDRNGEGGYRLNGARCRLTDVIEVLSDTGLGKETHSVISQGRVEAIVTSKPRDRRMLIEEAAGLGKHRKRRRRAQLKLEHTQENLDRALDVEREARTRLRPLKRQAEAAELHERLERQILQARLELGRDELRVRGAELAAAELRAAGAREERGRIDTQLAATIERRGEAERALAERADQHEQRSRLLFEARSSHERLGLRAEQAAAAVERLTRRLERSEQELAALALLSESQGDGEPGAGRIAALEQELAELARRHEQELSGQLEQLEAELGALKARAEQGDQGREQAAVARAGADEQARAARERLAARERDAQQARREAERVGAELAAANQFLRSHARFDGGGEHEVTALSDALSVAAGYELALAAALGGRLDAAVTADVAGAERLLDASGPDGGAVLLAGPQAAAADAGAPATEPPVPGARRLLELLGGPPELLAVAGRLLADAWVVETLESLPAGFMGIAATRGGRVLFAGHGEVRQLSAGGTELVLARRNERDRLVSEVERAAGVELQMRAACERELAALQAAEGERGRCEETLREAQRLQAEAAEAVRQGEWLIQQRRQAPQEGPLAVRRAELEGELAAERRQLEQRRREQAERSARKASLESRAARDRELLPSAERLVAAIALAGAPVQARLSELEQQLASERQASEQMTARLRSCAAEEAEIQARLRETGERVTTAEVAAQRLRDQVADTREELAALCQRLGLEGGAEGAATDGPADGEGLGRSDEDRLAAAAVSEPQAALDEDEREQLQARLERLERRREQLGPVNPLAQEEYSEALAHVEDLEQQRGDLEEALRELRKVIRDTDREIEQTFAATFEAAARNFEELVGDVFPGGSGRLRLVSEEPAPRTVLGGQALTEGAEAEAEEAAEAEAEAELEREEQLPGVEIEITPAGKSTKRLTLLSGGEKSMTALAFLFAVFLARPCPFYILDEVEAALDDINLDRFLALLRRYAGRAQFIVITHQRRTMEAADWLFGVSMGGDGVSKVLSRRLPGEGSEDEGSDEQEPLAAALAGG